MRDDMPPQDIWQKSSYSGGGDGNSCVELRADDVAIHLRESDEPRVALTTSPGPLGCLIRTVREGAFDRTPS
jgi:uncharacterized protein DUF397